MIAVCLAEFGAGVVFGAAIMIAAVHLLLRNM